MKNVQNIADRAVDFLKELISIRSYSGEEDQTADLIFDLLKSEGFNPQRSKNNVWAWAGPKDENKPVVLLNSHHDTVKASSKWTKDPFTPTVEDGKLYGLGSNDAGGPLVSLLFTFLRLAKEPQPYNLLFLASAEEETSGIQGVPIVLPLIGPVDFAIVGEPTSMRLAVAERGLIVLDCIAQGKNGHAARNEGINAIYGAIKDIEWFRNYSFEKVSDQLGEITMSVTMVEAGSQHNVVPDECRFVVDVRPNELYTNEEVVEIIRQHVDCIVEPRSLHLNASGISGDHPILTKAEKLNLQTFASKTMSDQAHMPFPSVKIGPGDTHRSHTSDEYIFLDEIKEGIGIYINLLDDLRLG